MTGEVLAGGEGEVAREDVRRFLSEWALSLGEAEPILSGLSRLADAEPNAHLSSVIRALHDAVQRGDSLSGEMQKHPEVFGADVLDAVSEGEVEGSVDASLRRLLRGEVAGEEGTEAEPEISVVAVAEFTRGLARMIGEGKSLLASMEALEESEHNARLKSIIGVLSADVQAGHTLSLAMRKFPEVFDKTYVDAVRLGEVNGNLDQSLFGLAHLDDFLSFDQALHFLGTSKATMYRLLSQKALSGLKVGRQWRFRKSDLVAYMERKPGAISPGAFEEVLAELKFFEPLAKRDFSNPQGFIEEGEESYPGERRVATLANAIMLQAIEAGASDIHLESARLEGADYLLLRNRVDGVLHEIRRLPPRLEKPLFDRFKIMADLNLDERALPQDGRGYLTYRERKFALRISLSPSALGGSLVIRIMPQDNLIASLDQMGLENAARRKLEAWMERPNGLILLAGMTGSGKTSTFYALLSHTSRPEVKTLTIEDPVEMTLPYATQVWVNARAGLTYASAVRAFLRQDPDIIGVGELRDGDTAAQIAQAAMTGHLIVATLHARSAVEGLMRLLDLNLQPFVAASATVGVVAQLLIRRLCPDCKEPTQPNASLLQSLRDAARTGGSEMNAISTSSTWARAVGCEKCRRTGYRGRTVLMEVLEMDSKITEALTRGEGRDEIEKLAMAQGVQSFAAQGAAKAARGETTVEEVMRALFIGNP